MPKKLKPTTPCSRYRMAPTYDEVTKNRPEKSLVHIKKDNAGRNFQGRITVRRRGGGHKKFYRVIDFKRNKIGIPGKVVGIEYDPNRSARIALIQYPDGEKRYIIAPLGLKVNHTVESSPNADMKPGNTLPLDKIPDGTFVHNVELQKGKGGQIARGAGTSAQVVGKEGNYVQVKLPSGEVRAIYKDCYASIGQVGNVEHEIITIGKAGRSRWLGKRPKVRGVAMNPVDHPLGGGEGKSSGGRHPCTPWGKAAKGLKTRKTKVTDRFILKKRKTKKDK